MLFKDFFSEDNTEDNATELQCLISFDNDGYLSDYCFYTGSDHQKTSSFPHIYKRSAIIQWLMSNKKDPMTRKENVDISDYPLLTFEESVKNNEVFLLKQFIAKGLVDDINSKICSFGFTALHLAAQQGHVEAINTLIEQGSNLEAKDHWCGYTALHRAVESGHLDAINTLIEKGSSLEAKDNDGQTALHRAALKGHVEAISTLIEK